MPFVMNALERALEGARPEIINSDQGSHFTCGLYTARLKAADIRISMDGRGRCMDNIFTERLSQSQDDDGLYALAKHVEGVALGLLAEYKPGRRLATNLEFWVAVLLHGVGLPPALFTPTFAAARTAGWAAHCFEQAAFGRMIQPRTVYLGERDRQWVSLEAR